MLEPHCNHTKLFQRGKKMNCKKQWPLLDQFQWLSMLPKDLFISTKKEFIMNQVPTTVDSHILWFETCSCRPVCYFETLFWDDITKFRDENLLFTFLTGKLRKKLFCNNKKFVYLSIISNFCPKITSENIILMTWKGFSCWKFSSNSIDMVKNSQK